MKRETITQFVSIVLIGITILSCRNWDEYKEFVKHGEKVYPGVASQVGVHPGNQRVRLTWVKGIDNRVTTYRVFWNGNADSVTVDASTYQSGDSIKLLIPSMIESSYTFTLYSYDASGNRSVPKEISSVNVYGPKYQNNLLNRPIRSTSYNPKNSLLTLKWGTADTVLLSTQIQFVDTLGMDRKWFLKADIESVDLPIKRATTIKYRSSYKPSMLAIDSFQVAHSDSIFFSVP